MFHILFEKANKVYEKAFHKYGRFLARNYSTIIAVSFVINFILSLGIMRMTMITDVDQLFMPSQSLAREHEKIIKGLFNSSKMAENFFLHQITDLGTWAEINFRPCESSSVSNSDNVLQEKYINEIRKFNEYLISNTYVKLNDSHKVGLDGVCAKRQGSCLVDGSDLLTPDFYVKWLNESMYTRMKMLKEQEMFTAEEDDSPKTNEFRFYVKVTSKGAGMTDLTYNLGKHFRINLFNESQNGKYPAYAKAIKLRYNLKSTYENPDKIVIEWEKELLKNIQNVVNSQPACDPSNKYLKSIKITYGTSQSLDTEMAANVGLDSILISGTFMLIMLFSSILMSLNSNCITSPGVILPLSGISSAIFGMTSAFGLLSYLNYPGCNLIFVIPFLVFGIGIDDMFIIYSSFTHIYRTHLKKEQCLEDSNALVASFISSTLAKSAVSVTITSLTDFVAFIVGVTTGFRSVEIFCMYAGFSILFCYFYQLTFFSGFLCLHLKRIQKKKNAFLFCYKQSDLTCIGCTKSSEEADSCDSSDLKATQIELIEKKRENANGDEIKNETNEICDVNTKCNNKMEEFLKQRRSKKMITSFFKFIIMTRSGKLVALALYLIYLTLSIWSASQIHEGINLGDLVAEDSYYNKYVNENNELIDLNPVVMFVIYKPIDYDNMANRIKIKKFINNALKIEGISNQFMLNWLDSYGNRKINYKKNDAELWSSLQAFPPMANDVIMRKVQVKNSSEFENQIVASRFYLQYSKLYFSSKDAKPMNFLRDLCDESGLPIIPYSLTFKFYEQFEETLPNIIQAFVISIEAMYLISLIFIPDLVSAVCILASMVSIMVGMIGLMNVWNLSLSSITMIELIMSIGFCVDFSAHIVHAFLASVGKGDRNKRAYKAITRVGLPIFNSAISTIVGICLLGFCRSYIFNTFFKSILILMSLGLLNSLIFLPVLLSVVGPNWPRHKTNEKGSKKVTLPDTPIFLQEK